MKEDISNVNFSNEELSLLDVINSSYLTADDVKWLKNKKWFKRFIKIYAKELKKRYHYKEIDDNKTSSYKKEDIEVLDFTQSIKIPSKEVVEILDFTKTIDITDIKDVALSAEIAKRKVKIKKLIWNAIIVICSIIILIYSVILLNWLLENKKNDDILKDIYEIAELQEEKITTENKDVNIITTKLSDYEKYTSVNPLKVNFNNLKSINSDTVGWIKVEGTNINYPFVQSSDNEYYLKRSFDRMSNKKGWVFLDYRNNIENLSKNNILYAHGLVNNTMFGEMRSILKKSWYNNKENHMIRISTPTSYQLWQVFSVYTIEPESYYITTSFVNDEEYGDFLSVLRQRSIHEFDIDLNVSDKILTLSSCYDNEKRMVLHAKLISTQTR